ncbi:MAG TPA: sugar transferase [Ensifer sp.]|nr:sugar transferase [Ensifer sp.]
MKRAFDLSVAIFLLVLASPVMAVVALLIRTTSPGPAIFSQTRVGLGEKSFQCLKFRTMAVGTPDVSSHQASSTWITPIGRVLRRTKLDELPQLVNVLRGEMSLVGPRPGLPSQTELLEERRRRGVFGVLPGITGRAQLAGIDMSQPQRLAEVDSEYIASRTFLTDLLILFRTLAGKGAGDAANT